MLFEVQHITDYRYASPVREAYVEARLTPPRNTHHHFTTHSLEFSPQSPLSNYRDYFGNEVTFYSMTLRHERLTIRSRLTVRTQPLDASDLVEGVTIAEARQLFSSSMVDVFDYLQPTASVQVGGEAVGWADSLLSSKREFIDGVKAVASSIHSEFSYEPGTTEVTTPLVQVWKQRKGVCQDFAQLMLSVLRTAGLPCRYVCGYIESGSRNGATTGRSLVGAAATHAWVEVLVPGQRWLGVDPTNDCWCGEQHIAISYGRDFRDAAPVRGTFKGSGAQQMKVGVTVKRIAS